MDYIILIFFLVPLTVLEVVQNIKTLKKPVVDFEFGIIKDRCIPE